jgi:DNA-binding IclR family transcriptional regulator
VYDFEKTVPPGKELSMVENNGEDGADAPRSRGSGSARKVLQILFSFSEHRSSATVAELAKVAGVPLPTAYRHVALLKELQLLEEGAAGTYRPTALVAPLARAAQQANGLVEIARPIVAETSRAFNETVMLMQNYGDAVVCIELTESDRPMRYTFERGHNLPLGSGASGKMALAMLSRDDQDAWMRRNRRQDLADELEQIQRQGFATSSAEVDEGVWACSVGVAGRGKHPIVLSVAGPGTRFDEGPARRRPARSARARPEFARLCPASPPTSCDGATSSLTGSKAPGYRSSKSCKSVIAT